MTKLRNLFATPKKAVLSSLGAIALVGVLVVGGAYTAGAVAESTAIGKAAAQNFAFANAGIDPKTAILEEVDFTFKRGQFVYEVEFLSGGTKYEYLIKASDGTVVAQQQEVTQVQPPAENELIGLEAAKQNALSDAGIAAADAIFTEAKLDEDDGRWVYDIEFRSGNFEYDYEIDALTGNILSRDRDQIDRPQNPTPAPPADGELIGLEAAKQNALADAGVAAADATFIKAELDEDDGRLVYEIEFRTSQYEYDYDIAANSGEVLSKDRDPLRQEPPASGSYIGIDRAKEVALNHAGLNASDVRFSKVKLEKDDGIMVYEVEFRAGGKEYEYTLDAYSGEILESEVEWDD